MTFSLLWPHMARLPASVRVAVIFMLLVVLVSYLGPRIANLNPLAISPELRLNSPSGAHLLGTDMFGRDIFTRVLYGGRVSLAIGLATAVLATTAGTILGLVAGAGQASDKILMRVMDGIM
ncbi:ABC transporter permease, partial [Mesorhizobium sp. M1E.F.Ca.ET.041.01.1.1]